jgi:hypothetical protein
MHYQMGSVLKLDVRLYRMTNVGIKVMGSALLHVGSMLRTCKCPKFDAECPPTDAVGGIIVAEFMMLHQEPSSSLVRFRLQTLRLANPDAQLSDTRIEVSKLEQGIWVKVDRWDRSVLELDTNGIGRFGYHCMTLATVSNLGAVWNSCTRCWGLVHNELNPNTSP